MTSTKKYRHDSILAIGRRRPGLLAASALFALAAGTASAQVAQLPPTCLPEIPLNPTLAVDGWAYEGIITGYGIDSRTITVNGMTFKLATTTAEGALVDPTLQVPLNTIPNRFNPAGGGLMVNTSAPETPKLIQYSCLVEPSNCYGGNPGDYRDIIGATVIASGQFVDIDASAAVCMAPIATDVEFLFGEHVSIGAFSYDTVNDQMSVNGQLFVLNTDPRLPNNLLVLPNGQPNTPDNILLSVAGLPIELNDLLPPADPLRYNGTLIAVEGYYVPAHIDGAGNPVPGMTHGVLIETEAVPANPVVTNDTVGFERVEYRTSKRELRVDGLVQPGLGRAAPTQARLYVPGTVDPASDHASCTGTVITTGPIDPADNTFGFRVIIGTSPTSVCVETFDAGGDRGAEQAPVTRLR